MFHGLPFVGEATAGVAQMIEGEIARAPMQPTRQGSVRRQLPAHGPGFAGEVNEDVLDDVGGEIAGFHLPDGRRVDEVGVAGDEFAEGGFLAVFGVGAK